MDQSMRPQRRPPPRPRTGPGSATSQIQECTPAPTPTCFEEIVIPNLSVIENKYKGLDREIAVCCKKCETYSADKNNVGNVYRWIQMEELVKWLQRPERYLDLGEEKPTMHVVDLTCCIGPMEFYVVWRNADYLLSKLLRRWLYTVINDNDPRFREFDSPNEIKAGQYVAAFYVRDGRWYRARVIHRICPQPLEYAVQLLDDGTRLELKMDRLRHLPEELYPPKCRPLAFRCQLLGLEKFSESIQQKVICTFIREIRYVKHLQVAVHKIDDATGVRSVTVADVEDPNKDMHINVMAAAKKYSERNVPELDLTEKKAMLTDAVYMIHMNYEVQVRDYSDLKLKGLRNWRITNVISPSEFYMEYIYEKDTEEHRNWHAKMQEFYRDPRLREAYQVVTSRIYKRRHYAWWNNNEDTWERVRCLDSDLSLRQATIYLIDYGVTRVVPYDELWELFKDFCGYTARAFKSRLSDVIPADGAVDWSEDCIDSFRKMVIGDNKVFHGVIVSGERVNNAVGGVGEETMDLSVILVEKNPKVNHTVQAALVVYGFAESTGLSSSRDDIFENGGLGKQGHFSSEDFKKYQEANSGADANESVVTQLEAKERLETLLESALTLPAVHTTDLFRAYTRFNLATNNIKAWALPREVQSALPQVRLAHVLHPGCIYVQRSSAFEEILAMMIAIGKIVEIENAVTEESIAVGDCIAVFHQFSPEDKPFWYRACVREIVVAVEVAKVILVDFGVEILSKFGTIRVLPEYFQNIPGFSYRIHVDIPNLIPVGSITWNAACVAKFNRYIRSWDDVDPSYFIWRPSSSSTIFVNTLHEQVVYNRSSGKWNVAPSIQGTGSSKGSDALFDFRHKPMLFNLFISHGVGLVFEIKTNERLPHDFGDLGDLLIKMGFATLKNN